MKSMLSGLGLYEALANSLDPFGWTYVDPSQLQNQLVNLSRYLQSPQEKAKQRRDAACQWFATKWRTRASEIGVYAAAGLMRKQGVPVDVAVSILATR